MPSGYNKYTPKQPPRPTPEQRERDRPRSPKERVEWRERIRQLYSDMYGSEQISAIIVEEFKIGLGQARKDVADEIRKMRQAFEATDRPARAAQLLESLNEDVRLARDDGQHSAAVAAKREIAKLTGSYAPEQQNITVTGQLGLDLTKLTPNERQQLRELLTRARRD